MAPSSPKRGETCSRRLPSPGPEEAEALSQRSTLEETSSYLDAAQALVQVELAVMDPSYDEDRDAAMIAQSLAEAEVTSYETSNASVLEDSAE